MRTKIAPLNASYDGSILFLNLRDGFYEIEPLDIQEGYDMCLILDGKLLYISLDPTLSFGVKNDKEHDIMGPYSSGSQIVSLHLFAKYDNLINFLTTSFHYSDEYGFYVFKFKGFEYHPLTYRFNDKITNVCRNIKNAIPKMDVEFEYETVPTTYFADGAIDRFLIGLSAIFNQINFKQGYKEDEDYLLINTAKASGMGVKDTYNGNLGFLSLNLSKKRHAMFFIPKRIPEGYVEFKSGGGAIADSAYEELITNAAREIVQKPEDVEKIESDNEIVEGNSQVSIMTTELFRDVIACINLQDTAITTYIFVRHNNDILVVEFNAFEKTFTIWGKTILSTLNSLTEDAELMITNGVLKFSYNDDIWKLDEKNSFAIAINETIELYLDNHTNKAYTKVGNPMSINYTGDLLPNIFL